MHAKESEKSVELTEEELKWKEELERWKEDFYRLCGGKNNMDAAQRKKFEEICQCYEDYEATVKAYDRMFEAIEKKVLEQWEQGKINKKLSAGSKLRSPMTIIKLSSFIVFTDVVLAGIEFAIYCLITKPKTIQDAFAISVPLLVCMIVSAIILDIIIIGTYALAAPYFDEITTQPIIIVNKPNPLEAPQQLQDPIVTKDVPQLEVENEPDPAS